MRLGFMGTPDFAVPALRALHAAGHEIVCVYTQPPRPAGRRHTVRPSPVQAAAETLGIPVRTPLRLRRNEDAQKAFARLALDAAVVAAYGLILPEPMLAAPRRGCLNIHASLLPRWRGAAPIQAAILAGDHESGVTIMQMDAGLDTGPMLARAAVPITDTMTAAELHDALAPLGADLIVRTLADPPAPVPQPAEGATYAPKLTRDDGRLDWTQPAEALARRVRALNPWPGTFCSLEGETLKVLAAETAEGHGEPGVALDGSLHIAADRGALRLTRVQAPGRAAMDAAAFLRGHPVPPGTRLD
ncbi:MAG TPA: methionyl-tRNA formyltransferase [Acetobacteraceae bacterium]|nr:methionyl-tRNA formyltransferase [Acetobacteraceae bacterium]